MKKETDLKLMFTDIFSNCYKYKFITKINSGTRNHVPELFYKFTSTKSAKTYHVHVEIHPSHWFTCKSMCLCNRKQI